MNFEAAGETEFPGTAGSVTGSGLAEMDYFVPDYRLTLKQGFQLSGSNALPSVSSLTETSPLFIGRIDGKLQ